jgi:mono/diheme cytochrome c family protein
VKIWKHIQATEQGIDPSSSPFGVTWDHSREELARRIHPPAIRALNASTLHRMKPRFLLIAAALGSLPHTVLAEVTPGELFISEMNCVACHTASPEVTERLAPRQAPRLGREGVPIKPQWLREFLGDPQRIKPGTFMPDMMHGLPEDAKRETIEALVHYLVSIQPEPVKASGESHARSVEMGQRLYHEVGCVQCHAPDMPPRGAENDEAARAKVSSMKETSVPLGSIAGKLMVSDLAAFLREPLKSRPSGRMPSMRLTAKEADAIADYLLREQRPPQSAGADLVVDKAKAQLGANYFVSMRCAECHQDAAPVVAESAKPALPRKLELLRARQPAGCLSASPKPGVPKFVLTDRQRSVILTLLQSQAILTAELTPEQKIKRAMTTLNCYACHSRDRRGGPDALHREYMSTVGNAELGDEGRIPPSLTGVGAKLQAPWLREVLFTAPVVRPYMATRMPIYGPENLKNLPPLFEQEDARPQAEPNPDILAPATAADAEAHGPLLVGMKGLKCIECHDFAGRKSLSLPGIDLAATGQRLKWDWFKRYLLDPQSLRFGTRMPAFWPGGIAVNTQTLDGDPAKQILAIWAYLARKDFTHLPDGLVR